MFSGVAKSSSPMDARPGPLHPSPIPPTPGAPSGVAADHRVEAQEIRQRPSAGERFQAPEEAQRGQRWRPALRLLARAEQRAPADGILSV